MVVDIEFTPQFSGGRARVLLSGLDIRNYDISPDGTRFLILKLSNRAGSRNEIIVVENWFEELRRLAPHPDEVP